MTDTVIAGTQPSRPLSLRDERGGVVAGDWQRWLGPAASEDERLLDRAVGPVLDIGCGPGRHVLALARRGVDCLGIDVTPSAVRLARSRGATVVEGSIFGPVPGGRMWATALLLDGNIGIGGDPVALLVRPGRRTRLLTQVTQIDEVRASAFTIPTDRPESDGTLEWDAIGRSDRPIPASPPG